MLQVVPSILILTLAAPASDQIQVDNLDGLYSAAEKARPGTIILVAPGEYQLKSPLRVKSGTTIKGSGVGKTIITHRDDWRPATTTLPDPEIKMQGLDADGYLIRLADKAEKISLANLTLRGPGVHGAIFGFANKELKLHHLRIEDFLYCGIRTFQTKDSSIKHCEFVDAGGRWKRGGEPGKDGGISGGAIFATWMSDTEISHNRFRRTNNEKARGHYGIKGRGGRRIHIHHNTIDVNFSIEFPFEGADSFEIDHNILRGAVSIPKYAGGKVPESGSTYDIHHNYFTTSYSIEFVRNGVKIHHNLFDFDLQRDGGNLISAFGKAAAPGPAEFHNNLVNNPGRGVIWINEPYNNLEIRNNHIVTRTTKTPRKEGLFGFNRKSDFSTIKMVDNLIECKGLPRPLLRNNESYDAIIRNNRLINVSDARRLKNSPAEQAPGLQSPLKFRCGVNNEMEVDGWKTKSQQTAPKSGSSN